MTPAEARALVERVRQKWWRRLSLAEETEAMAERAAADQALRDALAEEAKAVAPDKKPRYTEKP